MGLLIVGLCGTSVFLRVPHFHQEEETLHAEALFTEPGGKGYNQAVAAARMEASVTFLGAVGRDEDGARCEERLRREGIRAILARKETHTAYASILTDSAGANRVTVYPGAALTREDVRAAKTHFAGAGLLLLTPEIPREAFDEAVHLAAAHRVRIVLNPAPFFPWVREYLDAAWLLTPNRQEACALLGAREWDPEWLKASPRRMLVTLGGDGAVLAERGELTPIPSPPVMAVDTTGAGDCLSGVLCACLLGGDTLEEAALKAVWAASLSVTHAHVLDGLPRRCEVNGYGSERNCARSRAGLANEGE